MEKQVRLIAILLCSILLTSCGKESSPSEAYDAYIKAILSGISYEQSKVYFTANKIAEVESNVPALMKSMNKSREDVVAVYEKFALKTTKCSSYSLISETIDGSTASLQYNITDTCTPSNNTSATENVTMLKEGSWKISDVITIL